MIVTAEDEHERRLSWTDQVYTTHIILIRAITYQSMILLYQ